MKLEFDHIIIYYDIITYHHNIINYTGWSL